MRKINQKDLFERLSREGLNFDENQREKIIERIDNITSYQPKIGILGKTGSGKSSLTNALFGQDVCEISDIASCTREPKEILLSLSNTSGLALVDVPGVGESSDRDQEYSALYNSILPELDLVLWLLKADDRAFTSDQLFYENVVKPHLDSGKPFFFVLNQVDKIEPFREWDVKNRKPSNNQFENINKKINEVSRYFNIGRSKIVPVSASEKYNLVELVDEIVFSLPKEKLVSVARNLKKEIISEKAKEHIKSSSANYVLSGAGTGAVIGASLAGPVGAIIGGAIGSAVGYISSKCYISTATMIALNKGDNCQELNNLRLYRDNWLAKLDSGKLIISEYYKNAPLIVDRIDATDAPVEVYKEIWENYLKEIISLLNQQKYMSVLSLYKKMVTNLYKKFLKA